MKQALSYVGERTNNGIFEFRINKECVNFNNSKIVYSIIRSRHIGAKKYNVYVKYKTEVNSLDGIESWYCTCKAGMRTVGCCSHVDSSTFTQKQDFINIINSIEFIQWNKAKSTWILNILFSKYSYGCNCDECIIIFPKSKSISTFGSEYEIFLQPIIEIQKYTFISFCSNNCDFNGLTKESVALTFEKVKSNVILLYTNKIINKCRNCNNVLNFQFKNFKNYPPWIFIQTNESEIFCAGITKTISYWIQKLSTFKCDDSFR